MRARTMSFSATSSPRNMMCGACLSVGKAMCELLSDYNVGSSCLMEWFSLIVLTWSHIALSVANVTAYTYMYTVGINTNENQSPVSQQEVIFTVKMPVLLVGNFAITLHAHFIKTA